MTLQSWPSVTTQIQNGKKETVLVVVMEACSALGNTSTENTELINF